MKKSKLHNELEICELIRNKVRVLPADTVAWLVEHRRDKPRNWVQILASVRFFFFSVAFFLLCYPCEALEGSISIRVLHYLITLTNKNDIK